MERGKVECRGSFVVIKKKREENVMVEHCLSENMTGASGEVKARGDVVTRLRRGKRRKRGVGKG